MPPRQIYTLENPLTRTLILLGLLFPLFGGCVGDVRETTTQRTSTEQLLLSTAAERAVERCPFDSLGLSGLRVAIDASHFDSYDRGYVLSSLRHALSERGVVLVPAEGMPHADGQPGVLLPERVVELRNGALGINDNSWGIGLPPLPLPIPQTNLTTQTPSLYLFYRDKQEGWAKLQLWVYDPETRVYLAKSGDLWGHAYYSSWWILFMGPFGFSNDIYPDEEAVADPEEVPDDTAE